MDDAKWYVVHTYSGYENKVKANIDNPDAAQKKNEELAKELRDDIHNDESLSKNDQMDMDDI